MGRSVTALPVLGFCFGFLWDDDEEEEEEGRAGREGERRGERKRRRRWDEVGGFM